MSVFCSRCQIVIMDTEFHIPKVSRLPYTIKNGNLLCNDCYKDWEERENKK